MSLDSYIGKTYTVGKTDVVVQQVLAEGGFALVFLTKEVATGRRHALKRMLVNNQEDLRVCEREIWIMKTLSSHKNIVRLIDSIILTHPNGVHEALMLMEYCQAGNVLAHMNEALSAGQKHFSEQKVLRIFCDMLEAVAALHHHPVKPVIHRDLKVENILLSDDGHYKLCDFGSATRTFVRPQLDNVKAVDEDIQRFTTMSYRAPEMVDLYSNQLISTKADIWALGVLLFKLCFFSVPFGESMVAIMDGVFKFPESSVFSKELHQLICYLLENDPDTRPDIFQASMVAFGIARKQCPVRNLSNLPLPSNLPEPPPLGKKRRKSIRKSLNPTVSEVTKTSLTPRQRPKAGHRSASQSQSTSSAQSSVPAASAEVDAFGSAVFTHPSQPVAARPRNSRAATGQLIVVESSSAEGSFWGAAAPSSETTDPFGAEPFVSRSRPAPKSVSGESFDPRALAVPTAPASFGSEQNLAVKADTLALGFGDDFNPRASSSAPPTPVMARAHPLSSSGDVDAFGSEPFENQVTNPFGSAPFVPHTAESSSSAIQDKLFDPRVVESEDDPFDPRLVAPSASSQSATSGSTTGSQLQTSPTPLEDDKFLEFAQRHGPPAASANRESTTLPSHHRRVPAAELISRRQGQTEAPSVSTDAFGAPVFTEIVKHERTHRRVSSDVTAAIVSSPDPFGAVPFSSALEQRPESPRAKSLGNREDRQLINIALQQHQSSSGVSKPPQQYGAPARTASKVAAPTSAQGQGKQQITTAQRSQLLQQKQRLLQQKQQLLQQQQQQRHLQQSFPQQQQQQQGVPVQYLQPQQQVQGQMRPTSPDQQASVFANPLARSSSPVVGARLPPGQAAALSPSGTVVASSHLNWSQPVAASSSQLVGYAARQQSGAGSNTIGNAYFAF